MKSDKPNISEAEIQLLNSELYIRYIVSMLERYYGIDANNIRYQRTIVTTGTRGIRKGATYKPNDFKFDRCSFRTVQIKPNKQIATIHLNKLLV
jgi:hypothetical protein